MRFSLYNKKNQLDEMQEQTMRCIEANGFWLLAMIPGVITGVICFVVLQLCMHAAQKRRKKLDDPDEDEK